MSPNDAALIADVRADVADGVDIVVIGGRVAIFPDEIVGKSDDELLAYIAGRLADSIER
jgi:hypothetical protein